MNNVDRFARAVQSARDPDAAAADERLIRRGVELSLITPAEAEALRDRLRDRELAGRPLSAEALLAEEGRIPPEALRALREEGKAVDEPFPPGLQLGRYRIVREIARGGMGVVFEAEDVELHRRVALKILRDAGVDPVLIQRLHREAAIAAGLHHPNIVAIHEVGMVRLAGGAAVHFICMDYVEGRTFAKVLAEGGDPAERLRILEDTSRAVAYAHSKGVIHRDLKPSNVMIDRGGAVALTDFGLARSQDFRTQLTRTEAVMGTPHYMSPEQVRAADVTERADVWSLGVMLYEALAGRHPFEGGSVLEVYDRILRDEPTHPRRLNRSISSDAAVVCLKALEKEPARRTATALEFAEDLARVRRGEPVAAKPVSLWRRFSRGLSRRKLAAGIGLGALAAVLLVASLGIPWMLRREDRRRMDEELRVLSDAIRTARPMFYVSGRRDFHEKMAEVERALTRLEELSRVPPLSGEVAIWSALGSGWHFLGDEGRAERNLLRARALRPSDPEVDSTLARVYLERWMIAIARENARGPNAGMTPEETTAAEWARKATAEWRGRAGAGAGLGDLDRALMEARCAAVAGPGEEAIRFCEDGIARFKDSIGREEFWFLLSYMTRGERRSAALKEALAVKPQFALALFMVGVERQVAGDIDGALDSYSAAIAVNPRLVPAYLNLAYVKSLKGRDRETIEDATRLIAFLPEDGHPLLIARGLARQTLGDPEGALRDFEEAVRLRPDSGIYRIHRAQAYESMGRHDPALKDLDRAVELCPAWDEAPASRGLLLLTRGRVDEAIRDFDKAVGLNPKNAFAYIHRGQARQRKGDESGAMADYDQGIRLAPSAAAGYCWRGLLHLNRKEVDAALADFDAAQALDPRNIGIYINRASARLGKGDIAGALEDTQAAIALDPRNAVAHLVRSKGHLAKGDRKSAIAEVKEALRVSAAGWEYRAEAETLLNDLTTH